MGCKIQCAGGAALKEDGCQQHDGLTRTGGDDDVVGGEAGVAGRDRFTQLRRALVVSVTERKLPHVLDGDLDIGEADAGHGGLADVGSDRVLVAVKPLLERHSEGQRVGVSCGHEPQTSLDIRYEDEDTQTMPSLAAAGLGRAIVSVSVLAAHKHLKVIADDLTIDGQPLARQVFISQRSDAKRSQVLYSFCTQGISAGLTDRRLAS